MTTFSEFYGHGYETSSIPLVIVDVHEDDLWPVANNALAAKDALAVGLHPVVAVGGRTAADGRPMNVTGVVISFSAGLTIPTGRVRLNIADGYIVKNYISNIERYDGANPDAWENLPIIGQPVYVDDSAALGAGCTLSMSPLNSTNTLRNPMAGVLWYCQDEYIDEAQGGPNLNPYPDPYWTPTWSDIATEEHLVCILLANGWRELA